MRSVLQELAKAISEKLKSVDQSDPVARIFAIVDGNFSGRQVAPQVVSTWLTFWCQSMHKPELLRLQQVNNKRLLSYFRYELKKMMGHDEASYIAQGIAAIIDGIWLRGALSPNGIDPKLAKALIEDFLKSKLQADAWA